MEELEHVSQKGGTVGVFPRSTAFIPLTLVCNQDCPSRSVVNAKKTVTVAPGWVLDRVVLATLNFNVSRIPSLKSDSSLVITIYLWRFTMIVIFHRRLFR